MNFEIKVFVDGDPGCCQTSTGTRAELEKEFTKNVLKELPRMERRYTLQSVTIKIQSTSYQITKRNGKA